MSGKSQDKARRRARRKDKSADRRDSNVVPLFGPPPIPHVDEFSGWVADTIFDGDMTTTGHLVEQLEVIITAIRQVHPRFDPTAWTASDVDAMASLLEYMQSEDDMPTDQARAIALAAHGYLSYLDAHELWDGTDDVADYAREELLSAVGLEQSAAMIGEVDEEDERAALLATKPVNRLIELAAWIGDERPTTPHRWLKPALLPQLARALSIDLPAHARSMSSFAPLRNIWEQAQAIGVIEVNTVRAVPGNAAPLWHAGAPIEALRLGLASWIGMRIDELADDPELMTTLVRVIIGGMSDLPVGRHHIDTWPDIHGVDRTVIRNALRLLDDAADDGWVHVVDDEFVIPEELRMAVVMALPSPDGADDEPALLTVHIALDGTGPQVWRRIEVDSQTSLGEFHEILQVAFDWDDSHLHRFSSGGCTFVPDRQLADSPGCAHDEDEWMIGEFLTARGDQLVYEYDFGDGWRHVITLEETAPPLTDEHAHISGGAGMAPLDDVGGPGGWLDFIAAVNDPADPRYLELREWAGLDATTPLDPAAFDRQATNRQLRRLGL